MNNMFGEIISQVCLFGAALFLVAYVQRIIHEVGHLLFGWLTGYRLVSFRLGRPFCHMVPSKVVNGRIPYKLYLLGGIICNCITGIEFLIVCVWIRHIPAAAIVSFLMSITGFVMALLNGIPIHFAKHDSDGYKVRTIGESEEAMRAFHIKMQVDEQLLCGVTLKDMPAEWFKTPSAESMRNRMVADLGVLCVNRLMDEEQFQEAEKWMEKMIFSDAGLSMREKNRMTCNRIYCELVSECREEKLEEILSEDFLQFFKKAKKDLAVLRTEYVYALLVNKDPFGAREALSRFELAAGGYPYTGAIVTERKLMNNATQNYRSQCAE